DGRSLDFMFSAAFQSEGSYRESIIITGIDITALKQAQVDLLNAQLELAHASRLTSLGELTASIAHEVNQPLASVVSNAQAGLRWLRRERPEIGEAVHSLERLVDEAKRAGDVIAGVRALARKEAPQPDRFALNELVNETLTLLAQELGKGRVGLSRMLDALLPDVLADRIQIQQVLINLIMNATQSMITVDCPAPLLKVSTHVDDGHAVVSICDNGPGIDPALRERLFSAFVTNRADGMGLGLSVCASIVARHDGRIWTDASAERGATFRFSLPLCDTKADG
ncbi:sensor histidine kinase, partial [Bosea sp. TAB14]|uniref:sensor histidine kinase n=1 Tax=Bosea sp. TAB14 TaxID=3237481 RepID=UPI003F91AB6F